MSDSNQRIVITGIGLTAPNGNDLAEYRANLLAGKSGVTKYEIRYIGETLAGVCHFDPLKYQKRKDVRRGTRAGSIAIYCANEAVQHSGLAWPDVRKDRVGVFIGITEHGNVETENEIFEISKFNYDTSVWTHHHNPRTVANSPAGEVTLSLGITGPHLCVGVACAAGNAGLIQGLQMLRLGEVDLAIAGGVSESIHTFGIFAGTCHTRTPAGRTETRSKNLRRNRRPRDELRRDGLRASRSDSAGGVHEIGPAPRRNRIGSHRHRQQPRDGDRARGH
ncbi:MAG: 3-oxoacyl-acyl-carrier-protein synthase II [Planctomycetota bacterium]|nr:MAG: 3-oxoacyl-acyl-carrier-protein synthase II [Planctomycetota bacterium]